MKGLILALSTLVNIHAWHAEVVLAFSDYEPVQESRIKTQAIHHLIEARDSGATLETRWTLSSEERFPQELYFASRLDESRITILAVSVNEKEQVFTKKSIGGRTVVVIPIFRSCPKGFHVLTIKYEIRSKTTSERMLQLGQWELLELARYVEQCGRKGWDLRPLSGGSYGIATKVSAEVLHGKESFVVSSNGALEGDGKTILPLREVSGFYAAVIKKTDFVKEKINVSGTSFDIVLRKTDSLIPHEYFSRAIREAWPRLKSRLGLEVPHAVVMDYDAVLGGGAFGSYVVGVYTTQEISSAQQDYVFRCTGWMPRRSTLEYVQAEYSQAQDPLYDYVLDMVTHELGHLYFGFGLRSTKVVEPSNLWFALGLGVLLDRLVWDELRSYPSPLFAGSEMRWRGVYEPNHALDQRLIEPDTANDAKFDLPRVQIYAHSKSWAFLRKLRERVGHSVFDAGVLSLFRPESADTLEYEALRKLLDLNLVIGVEQEMKIR